MAVALAGLLAACTGGGPVASPATTSSTAPPSPAELDERVKKALAPPGAFDVFGGRVALTSPANDSDPGHEQSNVSAACGGSPLRVDSGISVSRSRAWTGGVNLAESVHAMSDLPGSVLLTTVQRRSRLCTTYYPYGRTAHTVVPDVPHVKPHGIDESYVFCERVDHPEMPLWQCYAYLARGTLLAVILEVGNRTKEAALLRLTSAVPIFAESLVKA
ncbi:hypothetical protein SAMN04488074_10141 [Lentzea albidocapillata subsp. violacea]|uniref:PknH-like extracellular domain-containing protein n=2 Tax=Lentzea albidocapillata TaxID=40571 RepID=A0A1G8PHY3_9PSEU|nr:hypothetical protein SAMN04488074_10141 [Lentzea albidocapillata subsp. violacea]